MVQHVRVMHDTRQRIRMRRDFQSSPKDSVDLELKFKKCYGIYVACDFFLHSLEGCDKVMLQSENPPNPISLGSMEGLSSNSGSL